MALQHFIRVPKRYRATSGVLLVGITLSGTMSLLAVFQVLPYHFDGGDVAAVFSQVFYYFAVFHPQSVDLLMSSREFIFEKTHHPILVLDTTGEIVDYNDYAFSIGRSIGIDRLKGASYDDYIHRWINSASAQIFEDNPSIFTIHESTGDVHYEIVLNEIYSTSHKRLGTHVEIKNITPTMTLVHKLQAAAYFDNLTGLRNRNYFILVCDALEDEILPLGVLVGDLNNLKWVNDSFGHEQGDLLLQKIAGVFNACKPHNSIVFRIGGDEFIVLVPETDPEAMERLVDDIRAECIRIEEKEGHPLSIALGYKMMNDFSQPIQEVVRQADIEMYRDKNERRRA